ncbi:MAG: toll/interleukin-1 receptor domain-containing protein, partial [Pseudonocardiaceae bacterium]
MAERYDVFLSHSSVDVTQAKSLATRLKEDGVAVFLSGWDLVGGRPWQDDLEAALDSSNRVAVLVGSSGLNPWHRHEVRVAVDRAVREHDEFLVIPVLLPGVRRDSLPK